MGEGVTSPPGPDRGRAMTGELVEFGHRAALRRREHVAAELTRLYEGMRGLVALLDGVADDPLRLRALRVAMREACWAAEDAHFAAATLTAEVPLAAAFPNGSPAPVVPTPRQVLYLAELARSPDERRAERLALQAANRRYLEAVAAHDAEHGKQPQRSCASQTKAGLPCKARALAFVERPVCHQHATPVERTENAAKWDRYLASAPHLVGGDGGDER